MSDVDQIGAVKIRQHNCGSATDAANRLPETMACEVCPEPRSKTASTSSPFFSKIFASLAIQGIHKVGDNVDTPQ